MTKELILSYLGGFHIFVILLHIVNIFKVYLKKLFLGTLPFF